MVGGGGSGADRLQISLLLSGEQEERGIPGELRWSREASGRGAGQVARGGRGRAATPSHRRGQPCLLASAGGCQRRETVCPHPRPPSLLWQGAYLLWLGLKGPVPMTGRCGPGRFIQRRRDWQAALPETPHITHFTRGEKNLTVWPTFLEQTTRQTTPAAFPKQPQPQPWGS